MFHLHHHFERANRIAGRKLRVALGFSIGFALWGGLGPLAQTALAQVIPDGTLGAEGSIVTPNVLIHSLPADRIDGGAIRGGNLFHSFQEFNINDGQRLYFGNPADIANIFSRITGSHRSDILGTLGVTGSANLFLLNPNGILFGPKAQLDIRGSFIASTADRFDFGNGLGYSATNPQAPPMLTLSVPIGLQYGSHHTGTIVNAGNLAVGPGQNIGLIAGTVANTGSLVAPGGEVTLLAVPGIAGKRQQVQLSSSGQFLGLSSLASLSSLAEETVAAPAAASLPNLMATAAADTGWRITKTGTVQVADTDIDLSPTPGTALASGQVNVSGEIAGNVQILGDRIALVKATIRASGETGGGTVRIGGDYQGKGTVPNATRTFVSRDSTIRTDGLQQGDGGRVIVWADEATGFYGDISARGGPQSGDGGFVEVSGKESLDFQGKVDTSAPNGDIGTLLLDPTNIIVVAAGFETSNLNDVLDSAIPDIGGGDTKLDVAAINNAAANIILQATNNIIFDTQVTMANLDVGITAIAGNDIVANAAIETARGDLIFEAGNNIIANAKVETVGGAIDFQAGGNIVTTGLLNSSDILGNAGHIVLEANHTIATGDIFSDSSFRDGGGIELTSHHGSIDTAGGFLSSTSVLANGGAIMLDADGAIATGDIVSFGQRGNGGQIDLASRQSSVDTTAGTLTSGSVSGNGGKITLDADDAIATGDITSASQTGSGGQIDFSSNNQIDTTGGTLVSSSDSGNSGAITIEAEGAIFTGYLMSSSQMGNGGYIDFTSNNQIDTTGGTLDSSSDSGHGGAIRIATEGAIVTGDLVSASQTGNGGHIDLNSHSHKLDLKAVQIQASGLTGGSITLQGDRVEAISSDISSDTYGAGQGGTLQIAANTEIYLNNSSVMARSLGNGTAGSVKLSANQLILENGAQATVSSLGTGNAGDLEVTARAVRLNNQAHLSAETLSSTGGNIRLQGLDTLTLNQGSPKFQPRRWRDRAAP